MMRSNFKAPGYPAYSFHQTDSPHIPVKLAIGGAATVWIKDIEVWHVPAPPPDPPERRPGEVVVKRHTFKDKPIHSE